MKIKTVYEFNSVLEVYFRKRKNDFNDTNTPPAQKINLAQQYEEITIEEMRPMLISKMEEKLNINIVSAETSFSVSKTRVEGDTVYLDVYEWTYLNYIGESGLIDKMGYGVNHQITLEKDATKYSIVSDDYNEGPLTNVSSSLSNERFSEIMSVDYSAAKITEDEYENAEEGAIEKTVLGYNPYKAAKYANTWVNHNAYGSADNSNYYNLSEYFNNAGADCTNYVSQCLYAGGVPMNNTGNINTGWWYNNWNSYSGSWITAPYNFNYFSALHTSYSDISNSLNIIPGNPVYYDWNGDGNINHATICVGYNSSGTPIVNSHSLDYYHVPWNYGSSSTKYNTVKITNDDLIGNTSGAAELKYGETYYAKIDNSNDTDCFLFTAPANKSFTFTTTGYVNTYGKLCSADGTVLSADDDSGDSNNFSISCYLSIGRTYYIYVSSQHYAQGFYGLRVS